MKDMTELEYPFEGHTNKIAQTCNLLSLFSSFSCTSKHFQTHYCSPNFMLYTSVLFSKLTILYSPNLEHLRSLFAFEEVCIRQGLTDLEPYTWWLLIQGRSTNMDVSFLTYKLLDPVKLKVQIFVQVLWRMLHKNLASLQEQGTEKLGMILMLIPLLWLKQASFSTNFF